VCGAAIVFAAVGNSQGRRPARMPLNVRQDPAGNVAVYRDAAGSLVGRVLGKDAAAVGYERLYMPHAATCRKETAGPPPGVTSLDAWREAAARKAKEGRRRRGKRRAPEITGIRIDPGSRP